jgi:general secretion pathway protein D
MITPTINEDGFVTVKIKPEISSVISYLATSSKNNIPIIDTSTAETIVMVKDGTSILIGGLSKEEKSDDSTGTPFLSKLPVIGAAFQTKTHKTKRTELLVIITPHIVSGDELTTGYARDLDHKMDKQYQAYQDFSEEPLKLEMKTYQGYPGLRGEKEIMPDLKPARNF